MKNTWMGYLRKIGKFLVVLMICAGICTTVFFLYDVSLEPVFYSVVLCGIVLCSFFLYEYYQYRSRKEHLSQIYKMLPVNLEEMPEPEDAEAEIYQKMIQELNSRRMNAEASKMKMYEEVTDYYTMWAHQIKTPISALRLIFQENPEEHRDEMGELFKIEQYVEMVLEYLRAEDMSADIKFEKLKLDEIIKEQIRKYARIFIGKKISLDFVDTEEIVLTDKKWLGFVIGQLLSNALKYTKKGKVSIYMDKTKRQTLVIEDTGIGIDASDLPRVFEKGFTGYNGRGEGKSTGIGLYLCAKIMKRLGNHISIESRCGTGTKVFLNLGREEVELM